MKMDMHLSGHGPVPGTHLLQFTIAATFDGPVESLTMTVVVPNRGADANPVAAIARAKELAHEFVAQASAEGRVRRGD